jgi:hypothetical protein
MGVVTDHIAPVSELWNSRLLDSVTPDDLHSSLLLGALEALQWRGLPGGAARPSEAANCLQGLCLGMELLRAVSTLSDYYGVVPNVPYVTISPYFDG